MKIFRTILETKQGKFLINAEHDGGALNTLRVHPIVDGIVWASLPLCCFDNVQILISQVKKKIAAIA